MHSSSPRLLVNASPRLHGNDQASILFAGDFYLRPDHLCHDQCDLFTPEVLGSIQQSTFSVVNFEGTLTVGNRTGIRKEGPPPVAEPRRSRTPEISRFSRNYTGE